MVTGSSLKEYLQSIWTGSNPIAMVFVNIQELSNKFDTLYKLITTGSSNVQGINVTEIMMSIKTTGSKLLEFATLAIRRRGRSNTVNPIVTHSSIEEMIADPSTLNLLDVILSQHQNDHSNLEVNLFNDFHQCLMNKLNLLTLDRYASILMLLIIFAPLYLEEHYSTTTIDSSAAMSPTVCCVSVIPQAMIKTPSLNTQYRIPY